MRRIRSKSCCTKMVCYKQREGSEREQNSSNCVLAANCGQENVVKLPLPNRLGKRDFHDCSLEKWIRQVTDQSVSEVQ